jgi:predicted O-methyltransferase YrrM
MMNDQPQEIPPLVAEAIALSEANDDPMASSLRTGGLLRTLAATKPGGLLLELGTGFAVGSAWLASGMDADAQLITLEIDEEAAEASRRLLAKDNRVQVIQTDATVWLEEYSGPRFDFVFVDTTVVKFLRRDVLMPRLAPGAIWVSDDLTPQPKWNPTHAEKVERFLGEIGHEKGLLVTLLDWDSGLMIASRRNDH